MTRAVCVYKKVDRTGYITIRALGSHERISPAGFRYLRKQNQEAIQVTEAQGRKAAPPNLRNGNHRLEDKHRANGRYLDLRARPITE